MKKRAGSTKIYILGFPMHKDELILLLVEADVMGSTTVYQNKFKNRQRSKAWMTQGRIIMDKSLLGPKQNYLQIQ